MDSEGWNKTKRGKVTYERVPHQFGPRDLERILSKVDPEDSDEGDIWSYLIEKLLQYCMRIYDRFGLGDAYRFLFAIGGWDGGSILNFFVSLARDMDLRLTEDFGPNWVDAYRYLPAKAGGWQKGILEKLLRKYEIPGLSKIPMVSAYKKEDFHAKDE